MHKKLLMFSCVALLIIPHDAISAAGKKTSWRNFGQLFKSENVVTFLGIAVCLAAVYGIGQWTNNDEPPGGGPAAATPKTAQHRPAVRRRRRSQTGEPASGATSLIDAAATPSGEQLTDEGPIGGQCSDESVVVAGTTDEALRKTAAEKIADVLQGRRPDVADGFGSQVADGQFESETDSQGSYGGDVGDTAVEGALLGRTDAREIVHDASDHDEDRFPVDVPDFQGLQGDDSRHPLILSGVERSRRTADRSRPLLGRTGTSESGASEMSVDTVLYRIPNVSRTSVPSYAGQNYFFQEFTQEQQHTLTDLVEQHFDKDVIQRIINKEVERFIAQQKGATADERYTVMCDRIRTSPDAVYRFLHGRFKIYQRTPGYATLAQQSTTSTDGGDGDAWSNFCCQQLGNCFGLLEQEQKWGLLWLACEGDLVKGPNAITVINHAIEAAARFPCSYSQ